MRTWLLLAKRSRAQSGLLATVCAVTFLLTAVLVGTSGYLGIAAALSVRSTLAGAGETDAALQVQTELAGNSAAQDAAFHFDVSELFSGAPIGVYRTVRHYPRDVTSHGKSITAPGGRSARIIIGADAALRQIATLVAGAWPKDTAGTAQATKPDQAAPAALQADAAAALGLKIGDTITVGNTPNTRLATIVATWRPADSHDPRWFGDPAATRGYNQDTGNGDAGYGPLILPEADLAGLGSAPVVNWTIVPDTSAVTAGDLPAMAAASAHLKKTLGNDKAVDQGGVAVAGNLAETVRTMQRGLGAVSGVTPVGLLMAALIGLIALIQLASLLVADRRPESALLRSRGASTRLLTGSALIEAAAAALIGAALGCLGAALVLDALAPATLTPLVPWGYAAGVAAAAILIFGFGAWRDAGTPPNRERVDDSGRARAAATISVAVLAVAAAAVATWQSLLYASPITINADGSKSLNVLVLIAPALDLVAVALVLLVLFAPLTGLFQRLAAASRRLQPVYSARQTARRLGAYAVCVLLVSLSVGSATLAAAYDGSWSSLAERSARLSVGADTRIDLAGSANAPVGSDSATASRYQGIADVQHAAPVLSTGIDIGDDDTGRLTAIPATKIGEVMTDLGGELDLNSAADAIRPAAPVGVAIPDDTTTLGITVTESAFGSDIKRDADGRWMTNADGSPITVPIKFTGVVGTAQVTLWLQDESGALMTRSLPTRDIIGGRKTTSTPSLKLPKGHWRLVAADISCTMAQNGQCDVTLSGLTASTVGGSAGPVSLDGIKWSTQLYLTGTNGGSFSSSPDGFTVGFTPTGALAATVRLMPRSGRGPVQWTEYGRPDVPPMPIVISQDLADALALNVGKTLDFRLSGSGAAITGKVARIAPLVPGIQVPYGILADLARVNDYFLRTSTFIPAANQVWLAGHPFAAAVSKVVGPNASVTTQAPTAQQKLGRSAVTALWLGTIGSLLLAAVAIGSVTLSLARSRRAEVIVLHAVGVPATAQARARLLELLGVCGIAMVFGIVTGLTVAIFTVLNLARSVAIDAPFALATPLVFAWVAGVGLLIADAVAIVLLSLWYAGRVRRQARSTDDRVETR